MEFYVREIFRKISQNFQTKLLNLFENHTIIFELKLVRNHHVDQNLSNFSFQSYFLFQYKNLTLIESYDLKSAHSVSDLHQLPKGSIILSIDNEKINSDFDIQAALASDTVKTFRFKLQTFPPHLPDFVVIEIDEYSKRGGPNILGFPGAENLIPISCEKVKRESKSNSKKFSEFRIGFPLEIALAVTAFKLQGRNEKLVKILMKDFAHVPGLINVDFLGQEVRKIISFRAANGLLRWISIYSA